MFKFWNHFYEKTQKKACISYRNSECPGLCLIFGAILKKRGTYYDKTQKKASVSYRNNECPLLILFGLISMVSSGTFQNHILLYW